MKLAHMLLASVAILGLVPAQGSAGRAAAEAPQRRFAPPSGDFVITRALIRSLSGGKQIVASRSYRVRIVADRGGYRMDGELIDVKVEAPAFLASLADAERKRPDTGLFPILLGPDGAIRDQNPGAIDMAARQESLEKAGVLLGKVYSDPAQRAEANANIAQIANSMPNSPWPADLLFAAPGERRISREVKLSDGSTGRVDVVLRVNEHFPCGIPQMFERIVTTHLAGSSRVSREVYTIEIPAS